MNRRITNMDKLDIRNKDIIEWYDGVISALLDLGGGGMPHLCLCVAWSPEYDERVYAVVPVVADAEVRLRELLGRSASAEHWDEITRIMNDAAKAHVGSVTVIATHDRFEDVVGEISVPPDEVPELVCGKDRTGEAYNEHRLFTWLDRLGLPKPLSWREKEQLEGEMPPESSEATSHEPILAEAVITLDPRPPNPRRTPVRDGYIANLRANEMITGALVKFYDVLSIDAGESAMASIYFPNPHNAGVQVSPGATFEVLDAVKRIGEARIVRLLPTGKRIADASEP